MTVTINTKVSKFGSPNPNSYKPLIEYAEAFVSSDPNFNITMCKCTICCTNIIPLNFIIEIVHLLLDCLKYLYVCLDFLCILQTHVIMTFDER